MGKVLEKQVKIINKLGLHARAATQLAQLANRFNAEVSVSANGQTASASSVLGLMMLQSQQGKSVSITSEGPDAEPALQAIESLIAAKFNESE